LQIETTEGKTYYLIQLRSSIAYFNEGSSLFNKCEISKNCLNCFNDEINLNTNVNNINKHSINFRLVLKEQCFQDAYFLFI